MEYRMEQLQSYISNQWTNLQNIGFADDPIYMNIVKKSIKSYARGMISNGSEYIFAIDSKGKLLFSTEKIENSQKGSILTQTEIPYKNSILSNFTISGNKFIGLKSYIPGIDWKLFVVENKKAFLKSTLRMTYLQILTFAITFVTIILTLIFSLRIIIGPIGRVRKAIHNIAVNKDFSRKVRIEYHDEIGELAFDFNVMTSNLDLAYKKLKRKALDEAIAKKEVFIREKETLHVLGKASDYKDPETGAHLARVSNYSLLISKALGQDEIIQDLLYYSAPLHDIGKLGIPDSILLNPGKLSKDEFEIIKTHTTIGFNILENPSSKYLKAGAVIAKTHHEKFDGTGYPNGLQGSEIPIFGRIVSIADVFDALTTKRPYKDAWPFEKAIDLIMEEKGKHFDPDLANLFLNNLSLVKEIYNNNRAD